ncbi:MAG: BMP family protein, partial [Parvibaculaceae bacterium]
SYTLLNRRQLLGAGLLACGALAWRPASAQEPLTVGILLPGSRSDQGWMESAYNGMLAAQKQHGDKIKVQMIENVSNADWEQALTVLAQKNGLVIGAAGQVQTSLMKVAKRFPKVKFSLVGGNKTGDELSNFAGYDVKQAEIAYVAGVAAGMMSKNGAISYVGGLEVPPIVNAGTEFRNGAASVNPNVKYFANFTGDFDDVAKAKEATMAAIAQGADIHYHIMNLGLRGIEQAAREKHTRIIGSYTERCGTDDLYIGYSVTGIGYLLKFAIDEALTDSWAPGYKAFGLAMGPEASDMIVCNATPEIKQKLEEAKQAIRDGKIKTLEG